MSIEENKRIAEGYFNAQRSGNLNQGLALLADDAIWSVPGNWEMSGTFTRPQIAKMANSLMVVLLWLIQHLAAWLLDGMSVVDCRRSSIVKITYSITYLCI